MVIMSEVSRKFLEEHLPDVAGATEPNQILDPLYDLIMEKGFVSYEEGYNAFGNSAQEVYDDVFYSNYA